MSLEATKNLSAARQLVKTTNLELESLTEYSSPSFERLGARKGGSPYDRVSGLIIRKERLQKKLTDTLDACLLLEEASQAELDSVDNLELRSMIYYREVCGMTWAQIGKEMDLTADASKKRYERGMKTYLEKKVSVTYPQGTLQAMQWLNQALHKQKNIA